MEAWLIPALIVGLIIVVVLALVLGTRRTASERISVETRASSLEAESKSVTDPAQFGQVTPGALTPAAASSSEQYYQQTGVGGEGPEHLAGPPAVASESSTSQASDAARPSSHGWTAQEAAYGNSSGSASRRPPLGVLAGAGAALGVALVALVRRKARRPSRVERLREQARKVRAAAEDKAAALPTAIPDQVDARTGAGGGLALALALGLFAALRQRQRESEAERLAAEAAAAAQAARQQGLLKAKLGMSWLARRKERVELPSAVRERALAVRPTWALVGAGLVALGFGAVALRRAWGQQPDWNAHLSDSAPSREPPASP